MDEDDATISQNILPTLERMNLPNINEVYSHKPLPLISEIYKATENKLEAYSNKNFRGFILLFIILGGGMLLSVGMIFTLIAMDSQIKTAQTVLQGYDIQKTMLMERIRIMELENDYLIAAAINAQATLQAVPSGISEGDDPELQNLLATQQSLQQQLANTQVSQAQQLANIQSQKSKLSAPSKTTAQTSSTASAPATSATTSAS